MRAEPVSAAMSEAIFAGDLVGVVQPRNDGLGGADPASEFGLGNPGLGAQLVNLLRHRAIGDLLFKLALRRGGKGEMV